MDDEQGNPWYKQAEREERINYGIAGAHVVMPFQCECCWMKVLEGRAPRVGMSYWLLVSGGSILML